MLTTMVGQQRRFKVSESTNINEVIKTTLNSFIQKLHNNKKPQNAYKRTKIKNAPKNI